MTRHLSSRRRLLVASGLLAFFGLTFTALFPRIFSKPRSLSIQDRSAPVQVQLASFGQDAEPSLEGKLREGKLVSVLFSLKKTDTNKLFFVEKRTGHQ